MLCRRRFAALLLSGLVVRADTRAEINEVIESMAAALAASDPDLFLESVDRNMPGFDHLRDVVTALASQNDVTSGIDLIDLSGTAREQTAVLDWSLQIRSRVPSGPSEQRRQKVTITMARPKKNWRVTALQPVEFFAPPAMPQP